MKQILAATIITLILCSGSAAYAQNAATAAQQQQVAPSGADTTTAMIKAMKPEDREKLVLMWERQKHPAESSSQQKQEKDAYEKMSPDDQLALAEQAGAAMYQSGGKPSGTITMVPLKSATVMQTNSAPQQ